MASIQGVYLALFGRPADPLGLAFFNTVTNNGANLTAIGDLSASAEYQNRFVGQSSTQIITSIYQSLFNRDPDLAGLTFFANALARGTLNINNIAIAIFDGAQGADVTIRDLKVDAANAFTTQIDTVAEINGYSGDAAAASGRSFIAGVTTTAPTAEAVTAAVAAAVAVGGPTPQNFTLTINPDSLTGTGGNDVFVASEATLSSADVIDGGQGNDTLRYASSGNPGADILEGGFAIKSVETISVTADVAGFATKFDLTGTTDVTTVTNNNSSSTVSFIGGGAITAVSVGNVSGGNTFVSYKDSVLAGTADAQTLNVAGNAAITGAAVSTINIGTATSGGTAGLETLNISSTGGASKLLDIVTGAKTINVTGDAALSVTDTLDGATLIDGSTFKGALTVKADSGLLDVVVKGGTGNDTADFSNGFAAKDSFDGGVGTDTIGLSAAQATAAVINGTIANVEQLNVTTGGFGAIDMDNFPGVTRVTYDAGLAAATTVKDAVTGLTVEVDVNDGAAGQNLTVVLKADGSADVVNLEFDQVKAGNSVAAVVADEAETLNILADDDTTNATGTLAIANISAKDATVINLTGDAAVSIAGFTGPATNLLGKFDASAATGNLTVTGVGGVLATTGGTILLGSGKDQILNGTGTGADTVTLGSGADVLFYTALNQSSGAKIDTVTDFVAGTDDIDLTALGIVASNQFVGNFANFGAAQGATTAGGGVQAVFQSDTNTLWVDINDDGTLNANDLQVVLTGTTKIAATDLNIAGVGVTFTANTAGFNTATAANSIENNAVGNENDTINATVAQLVGATIDGKLGTDVLNVSGTAALGEVADLQAIAANFQNVETINLANSVEVLSLDATDIGNTGGRVATINGAVGANQALTINNATALENTVLTNIPVLNTAGAVSMSLAQHNAFLNINAAGGADQIDLTTAGSLTAADAIETYRVLEGSTITVGTTAAGLARNVTELGAVGTVTRAILGTGAYTGKYTNFDATDVIQVVNGTNISGVNGADLDAVTVDFVNAAGTLTLDAGQNGSVTFANTTGAQTVALSAVDTFTVADGIENYTVVAGSNVTVSATNTAVNITGTAAAAATTVQVAGNTVTGTYSLNDTGNADILLATTGANIAGVNAGAVTTAETLNLTGNVTLTNAQYAGFTTITAGGGADGVIVTTAGALASNAAVENYTFNAAGVDTATFLLANAATTQFTASLVGGGADDVILNNKSIEAAATSTVTITNFSAADDQIGSQVNGASIVTGAYTTADAGNKITGQAGGNVIEIHSLGANGVSIAAPLTDASLLASLNAVLTNGGTVGDIANGNYTVVGYNGANAFVYQLTVAGGDGTAGGDDLVELVGIINGVGADVLNAGNFL